MVTLSFSEAIMAGLEQERAKACELNNLRLYKIAQGLGLKPTFMTPGAIRIRSYAVLEGRNNKGIESLMRGENLCLSHFGYT